MKENTTKVEEAVDDKVEQIHAKGEETLHKVGPKIKNFVKKTLPYVACVGIGILAGGFLTSGPSCGDATDPEAEVSDPVDAGPSAE